LADLEVVPLYLIVLGNRFMQRILDRNMYNTLCINFPGVLLSDCVSEYKSINDPAVVDAVADALKVSSGTYALYFLYSPIVVAPVNPDQLNVVMKGL